MTGESQIEAFNVAGSLHLVCLLSFPLPSSSEHLESLRGKFSHSTSGLELYSKMLVTALLMPKLSNVLNQFNFTPNLSVSGVFALCSAPLASAFNCN
jgi:hypothetical protein